jgi:hypothetical protein
MAGFEDSEEEVTAAAAADNAVGQAVVATAAFVSAVDLETAVDTSAEADFSKDIVNKTKTTSLSSVPGGGKVVVASAAAAVVAATAVLFLFKVYSS